jgi:hypothetical protein
MCNRESRLLVSNLKRERLYLGNHNVIMRVPESRSGGQSQVLSDMKGLSWPLLALKMEGSKNQGTQWSPATGKDQEISFSSSLHKGMPPCTHHNFNCNLTLLITLTTRKICVVITQSNLCFFVTAAVRN